MLDVGVRPALEIGDVDHVEVGVARRDARRLGLPAFILRDACRAIDLNGSVAKIEAEFARAGVSVIDSASLSV